MKIAFVFALNAHAWLEAVAEGRGRGVTHSYLIKVNDCRKKIHDGATLPATPPPHPPNISY